MQIKLFSSGAINIDVKARILAARTKWLEVDEVNFNPNLLVKLNRESDKNKFAIFFHYRVLFVT